MTLNALMTPAHLKEFLAGDPTRRLLRAQSQGGMLSVASNELAPV